MKTKIYLGLSVAAILTIMVSCNNQSTKTEAPSEGAPNEQTNGVITPQVTKKHTIPIADIKEMIGKYKVERQQMINKNSDLQRSYGESFLDTRCAWFSIDELKAFIAESEKNPKNKLSGIRMYYTVYPEKKEGESEYMRSIPEKDRNHVSLLLVPTYFDAKNQSHADFAPEASGAGEDTNTNGLQKTGPVITPSLDFAPALNHAALCPPNCPTAIPNSYLND